MYKAYEPILCVRKTRTAQKLMRKIQWVVLDKKGNVLGIFSTRKKAFQFFDESEINITKLIWNGFYHSEKALEYDPYAEGKLNIYDPMF